MKQKMARQLKILYVVHDNHGTRTQVRVMVFAVGKEQFVNGVILAKRSKKPLKKELKGHVQLVRRVQQLKAYGLTNGKFSLFSCPSITNENRQQRQPRFRALVAQTTKVNIDKSTSDYV